MFPGGAGRAGRITVRLEDFGEIETRLRAGRVAHSRNGRSQ
jgi:hypothetical protein